MLHGETLSGEVEEERRKGRKRKKLKFLMIKNDPSSPQKTLGLKWLVSSLLVTSFEGFGRNRPGK